jgi:two-component system chemotaxis response regulator CheB
MKDANHIIAIGASTGGSGAIKHILSEMPADAPAILIVHHVPESSSSYFIRWMDSITRLHVSQAADGDPVRPGHVYIAPAGRHLEIARTADGYHCQLSDAPPVNRFKPSVDVLFQSVANAAGGRAAASLLSGMGSDGVEGLKLLHEAGARTLVQDETSSVVWGMAGDAVKRGAVDDIVPLDALAAALLTHAHAASDTSTPVAAKP